MIGNRFIIKAKELIRKYILKQDDITAVYDNKFYTDNLKYREKSAKKFSAVIYRILKPKSVISLGCGNGMYLNALRKLGNVRILGIDGSKKAKESALIPPNNFLVRDLRNKIKLKMKFDLAISIEVAEHLEKKYADNFVANCCSASKLIIFTAAPPGQAGRHHVNLQPKKYWIKKFHKRGYHYDKKLVNKIKNELPKEVFSFLKDNLMCYSKRKNYR